MDIVFKRLDDGKHMLHVRFVGRNIFSVEAVQHLCAPQWLKWSCEAGGSPNEARLEQTPYPITPWTQLIWRYLGIK